METLSDAQQHILSYIIDHPGCRVREIHEAEGAALGTIHSTVARLRDLGLVHPTLPNSHADYGKLLPVESQCPAPIVDVSTVALLPLSESTTDGTGSADTPGPVASVDPVSPSVSGATTGPLAQTESVIASPSDVTIEDYSTLGDAARELAAENAWLRDELATHRDQLRTLGSAAGLTLNNPAYDVETMSRLLKLYPILQEERNAALDKVADLRRLISGVQLERDRLQDALAEISSLCLFLGFDGSGDTMDQVLWLLTTLGGGEAVHAFKRRQLLQAEAMELEAQSLNWRAVARDWVGKAQALRAVGPCPRVGA